MDIRTRRISQSMGLYVSNSPTSGASGVEFHPLPRIQDISMDWNRNLESVGQFGQLFGYQIDNGSPTVNGSFSYYATNAENERLLGFVVDGSQNFISKLLNKTEAEKNYLLVAAPEGEDLVGYDADGPNVDVIGLGNAYISNYSIQGQVGGYPTASVSLSATNVRTYEGGSGLDNPAVNPQTNIGYAGTFSVPDYTSGLAGQPFVLKGEDITIDLGGNPLNIDQTSLCIQSFNFGVDLNLTPQRCLGSKGPKQQDIEFPVEATLSVEAEFGELIASNLIDVLCGDNTQEINIRMREPQCTGSGDLALWITLKGAVLESQSINAAYNGGNQSATLNFRVSIGGPQDDAHGVFISGKTALS